MKLLQSIALITLASLPCSAFSAVASPATIALFEEIDTGEYLPYRLLRPENFDPDEKYPVMISLHGGSATSSYPKNEKNVRNWIEHLVREDFRDQFNCYIICPHSPGAWRLAQFRAIKDVIAELPSVDTDRIYAIGHSMGGQGVYTFIQSEPEYFAAVFSSSANGNKVDNPEAFKDLPVWTFHGDKDGTINIAGNQALFAKMQQIGGNMKFTTWINEAHGSSELMVAAGSGYEFFDWDKDNYVWVPATREWMTQLSSDLCDPETFSMKWLFSKSRTAEPVDPLWFGFEVIDGYADTGSWLGWVNVQNDPYVYSHRLESWMYATGPSSEARSWFFVFGE
ncbi:hypothetical protein G0Q06_00955 [Puniceicoccales bacterium CK1056]|uniref:Dienelactone hydrolase domain-containing protein n=1 Tax=Oceanipulchritudo coccoides TaxID=2706888 RepID=A0A6B2LX12_9BACT|nr:dienelactone hydrolase family protein [Oceanipulchritudo coccoides]NDV61011.1 hypothetical protein [Oceanipulchritudo coccoides]